MHFYIGSYKQLQTILENCKRCLQLDNWNPEICSAVHVCLNRIKMNRTVLLIARNLQLIESTQLETVYDWQQIMSTLQTPQDLKESKNKCYEIIFSQGRNHL